MSDVVESAAVKFATSLRDRGRLSSRAAVGDDQPRCSFGHSEGLANTTVNSTRGEVIHPLGWSTSSAPCVSDVC